MLQIRSILLRGEGVEDAVVSFEDRANVLAGESDTGKSYLVHCLDYIFGADEMRKRITEAERYSQLFVEFENQERKFLTLERSLAGGDLRAYQSGVGAVDADKGEVVAPKRSGRSLVKDVTSVLFEFAGIGEAKLRMNEGGEVQRLTLRTMLPVFLVDEISVIDERSPVLGRSTFDTTSRKRAFAYMLSGKDDTGIIATEKREIANARLNAQLGIIDDLLSPIEQRLEKGSPQETEDSVEKVEEAIAALTQSVADHSEERASLVEERRVALTSMQHNESQIISIDEVLRQYGLLDGRYRSDLERLDFIAEGAHFFESLQEVTCPLCDQLMSADHTHKAAVGGEAIYQAAKAEASKILAHRTDLEAATSTLTELRTSRESSRDNARRDIERIDSRIRSILAPAIQGDSSRLDRLVARRLHLETKRNDEEQAQSLRTLRVQIEQAAADSKGSSRKWEPLPSAALRKFCLEVEAILKEWRWKGAGRVEFDQDRYDIVVDGQSRQSHGKGVRAVLYAAFVFGLLKYCRANKRPHLGTVVIDSPLTSYKKGKAGVTGEGPVDPGIESAFWQSLKNIGPDVQIIVIENKEPPDDVATDVHYEWFAGGNAQPGDRSGFIPAARG